MIKGKLDALPVLADHRDELLSKYMTPAMVVSGRKLWNNPIRLNQGKEGACVGFGWTGFLNSRPISHTYDDAFAFELYHKATTMDQYPGDWRTGQQGTDVRVGAKVVMGYGNINGYAFAKNVDEVAAWLLNSGPVVIGVPWYHSMDDYQGEKAYCYVDTKTGVRGWHSVVVDAVDYTSGTDDDWFGFPNSWGSGWGNNGRGRFTKKGFNILLNTPGAVAVTAVDLRR